MTLRRTLRVLAASALLCAAAAAPGARAQLAPLPHDQGAAGLGLALRRLGVTARVLYVTAHPDDEHNGVLVRLSRGLGLRTALLTLTRGDGGQNEIGTELFEALGILRSEELHGVHRYDAVEQYFGQPYEFGYSFSVEETFEKWGKEETLGDVVRVVRAFRPDVILTLPLEAAGGGQHHQAAARLAVEAFRVAADPARFPEQLREGLRPWQARKVYQGGVGGSIEKLPGPPPVVVPAGALDPLLGMSAQELGSIARASHRSQGTSQLKSPPGEGQGLYVLVDSEPKQTSPEADLLDGIDVTVRGLARLGQGDEAQLPALGEDLATLQSRLEAARESFDARALEESVAPLVEALLAVRELRARVSAGGRPALLDRLADEEADVLAALSLAQGLSFEVLADDDQVVPGQSFTVTATLVNQGALPVEVAGVELRVPAGWRAQAMDAAARALSPGQRRQARFDVTVGTEARYSQPYWKREGARDRYVLDVPAHATLPWSPPDVVAALRYRAGGRAEAVVETPALWRYEGPFVGGEKQKLPQVVPALAVRLTPATAVLPLGTTAPREFRVAVLNNVKGAAQARVRLEAPAGWAVEPRETTLALGREGEEVAARFTVRPPPRLPPGLVELRASAQGAGREFREGYQVIVYDHVQERHLFHPAATRLRALDVRVAPGVSVGYVMGAGDAIADALTQLGARVTLLGPEDIAYGDLSRYTTIVTGIRAYQTRPDLRSYHHRLLRYMENGGHLVVQYNKFEFNVLAEPPRAGGMVYSRPARTDSPFAPYAAAVSSNRVSDENAPVRVLDPGHALFRSPNALAAADWEGWVQERGLYFLEARDPRYTELLAMTDPFPKNAGEKRGALVEARVGRGTWTYVGLGLFRQIPAGTPGAWRLLANLVSRPPGR
jgi:LmbE family N-acetylglucosaminyl deacetylase